MTDRPIARRRTIGLSVYRSIGSLERVLHSRIDKPPIIPERRERSAIREDSTVAVRCNLLIRILIEHVVRAECETQLPEERVRCVHVCHPLSAESLIERQVRSCAAESHRTELRRVYGCGKWTSRVIER